MTVKELKHMLENADDNAIVVVRNNWAPAEFLNTSARKMVLVKTNGKLMTRRRKHPTTPATKLVSTTPPKPARRL